MLAVGDPITVENGNFCCHGEVVAAQEGDRVLVSLIRSKPFKVPLSQVIAGHKPKVGKAMDDLTVEEFYFFKNERDNLRAENEALAEIIAMQSDAIAELSARTCTHEYPLIHVDRALPAGGEVVAKTKDTDEFAWFEKLVDLLELYLARQLGTRRPISISDVDLRNLVQHILD